MHAPAVGHDYISLTAKLMVAGLKPYFMRKVQRVAARYTLDNLKSADTLSLFE